MYLYYSIKYKGGIKMLSLIKKILAIFSSGESSTSSLMERALESSVTDNVGRTALFLSHDAHDDLDDMMMQQQALDNELLQQQIMRDMHDPYLNPGQDHVVDETYHGIDHGMDHHHDF